MCACTPHRRTPFFACVAPASLRARSKSRPNLFSFLPVVMYVCVCGSSVALGAPGEADYQAGYRDVSPVHLTVSANRPVVVQVVGLTATFGYSGPLTNPAKPASHLRWAPSAAGLSSTTNHMGSLLTLASLGAGTVVLPLHLRTLWSYATDVPGSYSLGISFTLSSP
jgi:hypothetical protein